jgi:hypothetical protein
VRRIANQSRIDSQEETFLYQAFEAFLADKDRNFQLSTSLDSERFLEELDTSVDTWRLIECEQTRTFYWLARKWKMDIRLAQTVHG